MVVLSNTDAIQLFIFSQCWIISMMLSFIAQQDYHIMEDIMLTVLMPYTKITYLL